MISLPSRAAICDYARSYPQKIRDGLPGATGAIAAFLPIAATLETLVAGMAVPVSMRTRLLGAAITFGVLPFSLDARQKVHDKFGVTDESSSRRFIADVAYGAGAGLLYRSVVSSIMYFAAGETDMKKIVIGAVSTALVTALSVPYVFGVRASFQTAAEHSRTLHPSLAQKSRGYATRMMAASVLFASGVYAYRSSPLPQPAPYVHAAVCSTIGLCTQK